MIRVSLSLLTYLITYWTFTDVAYWTRSLSARDQLQHLTSSSHPHPCDEAVLDDETRRLLDDCHLLIATQRLLLLDIIGQGLLTITTSL